MNISYFGLKPLAFSLWHKITICRTQPRPLSPPRQSLPHTRWQTMAVFFVAIFWSLSVFSTSSVDSFAESATPPQESATKAQEIRDFILNLRSPYPEEGRTAKNALMKKFPLSKIDIDIALYQLRLRSLDPAIASEFESFNNIDRLQQLDRLQRALQIGFPFENQKLLFEYAFPVPDFENENPLEAYYDKGYIKRRKNGMSTASTILRKLGEHGIIDIRLEFMLLNQALYRHRKEAVSILNSIGTLHGKIQKVAIEDLVNNHDIPENKAKTIAKIMTKTELTHNTESLLVEHFHHPIEVIRTTVHQILYSQRALRDSTLQKLAHSLFDANYSYFTPLDLERRVTGMLLTNYKSNTSEVYHILVEHLMRDLNMDINKVRLVIRILIIGADKLSHDTQQKLAQLFRLGHHDVKGSYWTIGKVLERIPDLVPSARKELHFVLNDTSTSPERRKQVARILDSKPPGFWGKCARVFAQLRS